MASGSSSALTAWHADCLHELTGLRHLAPEPKATCSDCVMCAGKQRSGSAVTFRPDVKCCSHIPTIPNFLVGQALSGSGAASARARIAGRAGVTPLGLGVSHQQVHSIVDAQPMFGRSADVLCPHFDPETRGCGIWQTRNAVCSTWFCQHERGAVSQRFWQAVRDLLMAAEERLAYRCLTGSGLPESQVHTVLAHRAGVRETIRVATAAVPDQPDQSKQPEQFVQPVQSEQAGPVEQSTPPPRPVTPDEGPEWYDQLWGDWAGREEEWFVHCARMIQQVTPADLVAGMDRVRHLTDAVNGAWRDLQIQETPSQQLTFAPGPGSEVDGDVLRLVGYSPFDPVTVPVSLLGPLRVLARAPSAMEGLIDPDLLRHLADYGVVIGTS